MNHAILLTTMAAVFSMFARTEPMPPSHRSAVSGRPDTTSYDKARMQRILAEILAVAGLKNEYELREGPVNNIEATYSRRRRRITYNPLFINSIAEVTRNEWAIFALVAHEVGHHKAGHTFRRTGSKPNLELEADEFAGYVLQKLGAGLLQSQQVMHFIARMESSRTHPARVDRMQAIRKGWEKAQPAGQ